MSALPASEATSSWRAQLDLTFARDGERTRLIERKHVGPLVVQRPFYPEGDLCHVYLVHPPGGVVGGDALELNAQVQEAAHVLLTTPAATKFYKSGGRIAQQSQRLNVRSATCEWLPQENIFFADAQVRLETRIQLTGAARFIGWELACYGRPASGEVLGQGKLLQNFELWRDEKPLLLDRLRLDGMHEMMHARWGLAGYAVLGTLLAYPLISGELDDLRAIEIESGLLSCTCVDGVLVCRGIGAQVEPVKKAFVRLWQALRPRVLHRPAVLPRIWAT